MTIKSFSEPPDKIVKLKVIQPCFTLTKSLGETALECYIRNHRIGNEWQGTQCIRRFDKAFRREIQHPVAQATIGSGRTIMHFIGMENDNIAWQTEARSAAISEGLNA